jgi:pimeloyl-ACP methyl ester carboxylesterase
MQERIDRVDGIHVRSLVAEPTPVGAQVDVVIIPGLGALGYLTRLCAALAVVGARCTLLDLPGFGSRRPLAAEPTVAGVADTVAEWLNRRTSDRPVILLGHSSGAQAAVRTARSTNRELAGLVLAGPTFAPAQRQLGAALVCAAAALRRDPPTELRILRDYLRGGRDVLTLLRSALDDRPEDAMPGLGLPLLLTAGSADSLAPYSWLCALAEAARPAPAKVVRLPGSHNNVFTHPEAVAGLVMRCLGEGRPPELRGALLRQPSRSLRALGD